MRFQSLLARIDVTFPVSDLSGLSNKMADRHVRTYKPDKRHAVLAVDSAETLAAFLFETHRCVSPRTRLPQTESIFPT
ncbi:MAG: abortive infection family protein [Terriglobia bacterium]